MHPSEPKRPGSAQAKPGRALESLANGITVIGNNAGKEAAIYVSHQGLQAMHQERVNAILARVERQQMLHQARDAAAERRNRTGTWRGLHRALLGALLLRVGKLTYDPSTNVK